MILDKIVLQVTVGTVVRQTVEIGDELLCRLAFFLVALVEPRAFENHILMYLEKGIELGNHHCIPTPICTGKICGCECVLCAITHAVE